MAAKNVEIAVKMVKYGKADCRLLKMDKKNPKSHSIRDLNVQVLLRGNFEESFTKADNTLVVPTDTVKNTVYVLAKDNDIPSAEEFAVCLVDHFLRTYSHVSLVEVKIDENNFERMVVTQGDSSVRIVNSHNSFIKLVEARFVQMKGSRTMQKMWSGVKNLHVLKTGESGFENYLTDKYTTLKPSRDRVFRTEVFARWRWPNNTRIADFNGTYEAVRQIICNVFATTYSQSVQETIYLTAKDTLSRLAQIEQIHIRCPNIHCIPVNSPVQTKDPDSVLQVTHEPYGLIQGKFTRKAVAAKL